MAVIIFKAIEKCNSNCIYCNVIKKHQDVVMDMRLVETVFLRINEFLLANPLETVTFTWHGGEVCLLGEEYLRKAFEIQTRLCPGTGARIKHLVQSNLTLITQGMIDAFKQLGITQIGSSFEPIPHIRGFGKNRDSDAYNKKFFEGVNLLEKNGISWGVIYVVHRQSLKMPLDIFYYLVNLNLTCSPNFNPVLMYGEDLAGLSITPAEFADFLGAIFPVWWNNRQRYKNVKPFSDYHRAISTKSGGLICGHSGTCANHWVYIGPDGETSHCGVAGDFWFLRYGNIRERTLVDILYDGQRRQFIDRVALLAKSECAGCRFWGICHGGCPMEARVRSGDLMKRSPFCETTKLFVEKYYEPVTGFRAETYPEPAQRSW
jgi:uncharacterized protein